MRTILLLCSKGLIFGASYFWIRGPLWRSKRTVSTLASGSGDDVIRTFTGEKGDSVVAFTLLALGMLLDGLVTLLENWDELNKFIVVIIMFVTGILIYFVGNCWSRSIGENYYISLKKKGEVGGVPPGVD